MSRTIDQRVVEMNFDNSNFEKNVDKSLSTLDKLKAALHIGKSADDFKVVEEKAESLGKRFSIFEEIATGALRKFGSNLETWAEKTLKIMSGVENLTTGFQKFTDMTDSVATLKFQGFDMDTITEQLERLNWFSDETSYSLTDMTSNIAKFTAAGQGLEDASDAIMGVALWAAMSGQNASTASRAMYQLSQAMGSGMRKQDWMSIQNANMDTAEFRQRALDAGVALGTLKKNADGTYRSIAEGAKKSEDFAREQFADHLTEDAWFTKDVMMEVFRGYSSAVTDIYNYVNENGGTASDAINLLSGSLDEFGMKAFRSAQEARTWGAVVDSVKDAASSSWMSIFQNLFGNYDQAVVFFTALANDFYDLFVEPVNTILSTIEAWNAGGGRRFFTGGIVDGVETLLSFSEKLREASDEVFFGSGSIETAMHTYADSFEAPAKEFKKMTESAERDAEAFDKAVKPIFNEEEVMNAQRAQGLLGLTKGFHHFIGAIKQAEEENDGLLRGMKGLMAVFNIVRQAVSAAYHAIKPLFSGLGGGLTWIFDKIGDLGDIFTNLNAKIAKNNTFGKIFTTLLKPLMNIKTAIGEFTDLFLPKFKEKWTEFKESLTSKFGSDGTAGMSRIRRILADIKSKWENLFTNFDAEKAVDGVFRVWEKLKQLFRDIFRIQPGEFGDWLVERFDNMSSSMQSFWESVKTNLGGAWNSAKEYFELAESWINKHWGDIVDTAQTIVNTIYDVFQTLWNAIKKPFGGGEEGSGNFLEGLINMLKSAASIIGYVIGEIVKLFDPLIQAIKNTLGTMNADNASEWIVGGGLIGLGVAIKKFADSFGTNDIIQAISSILDGFAGVLNSFAHTLDAKALKTAAIGVAVLVGSFVVLMGLDMGNLVTSAMVMETVIIILARALRHLSGFNKKLGVNKEGLSVSKSSGAGLILAAALSMILIAAALRMVAKIPENELYTAMSVMTVMVVVMTFMIKAIAKVSGGSLGENSKSIDKSRTKLNLSRARIGNRNSLVKVGPGMTIISIALFFVAIWFVLKQLVDIVKNTDTGTLIGALAIMAGALAALVIAQRVMNKAPAQKGNWLGILAFAAGLAIIAAALGGLVTAFGEAKGNSIEWALAAVGGILLALIGLASVGSTASFDGFGKMAASMLLIAVAVGAIALVVKLLADSFNGVKDSAITGAVEAMVMALGGLVVAVGILAALSRAKINTRNLMLLSAAMAIMAGALAVAAGAAWGFSQLDWSAMAKAGLALAALVAAVAVIGALASTRIGDGLIKLGRALLYVGGAIGLIGAGFLAAALAIKIFGDAETNVKQAAKNIGDFIDEILVKLPDWSIKFFSTLIETIFSLIPAAITGLLNAVIDTLDALLEGDKLKNVIDKVIELVCVVFDRVAASADRLIESFGGMVVGLLESLGTWINNNATSISDALRTAIEGVVSIIIGLLFDSLGEKIFGERWEQFKEDISGTLTTILTAGALIKAFESFGTLAAGALDPLYLKIAAIIAALLLIRKALPSSELLDPERYRYEGEDDKARENRLRRYYATGNRYEAATGNEMPDDGGGSQAWSNKRDAWVNEQVAAAMAAGMDVQNNALVEGVKAPAENIDLHTQKLIGTTNSIQKNGEGLGATTSVIGHSMISMLGEISAKASEIAANQNHDTPNVTNNVTFNIKGSASATEIYRMTSSVLNRFADRATDQTQ